MIVSLQTAIASIKDTSISAKLKNQYLKQVIDRIEFSRDNHFEFILDIDFKNDRGMI